MSEPVTLDELKAWARVDFTDDDDLITDLGVAAREYVEQATGKDYSSADATVPEKAKVAIKALTATWYAQREAVAEGDMRPVPMHVRSLIHQLRGGVLEPAEAST